jgi:predicted dehydrogenase
VSATALQVVDNSELYAVGSSFTVINAEEFAAEFNAPAFYGSYEELVRDANVDIV